MAVGSTSDSGTAASRNPHWRSSCEHSIAKSSLDEAYQYLNTFGSIVTFGCKDAVSEHRLFELRASYGSHAWTQVESNVDLVHAAETSVLSASIWVAIIISFHAGQQEIKREKECTS